MLFFFGMILYGIVLNLKEDSLQEAMQEKKITAFFNPSVVVDKKNYNLELYEDTILVKTYKAVFGKSNRINKESFADNVTPAGQYAICRIDSVSKYHRFLLINYPSLTDVIEAYKKQWITKDEYYLILQNIHQGKYPFENMEKFTRIGIQGIGTYDLIFRNLPFTFNWTDGSIAISNTNIDELYRVVKLGTPVNIKE